MIRHGYMITNIFLFMVERLVFVIHGSSVNVHSCFILTGIFDVLG